jgi:hypothetical protein
LASAIGAQQRPDQDHGGPGGADDACDQCPEAEQRRIGKWGAAQIAGDEDSARHHVEREQQHNEAEIFRQHGMHESSDRNRPALQGGERRQRQPAPGESDLAVMIMPDARKQQRPDRDRQENSAERQRPWPAHCGALERRRSQRRVGNEQHQPEQRGDKPFDH